MPYLGMGAIPLETAIKALSPAQQEAALKRLDPGLFMSESMQREAQRVQAQAAAQRQAAVQAEAKARAEQEARTRAEAAVRILPFPEEKAAITPSVVPSPSPAPVPKAAGFPFLPAIAAAAVGVLLARRA